MAVYMATGAVHSSMPDDCPMKIGALDSEKNAGHPDAKSDRSCQVCQLCMPLAAQDMPTLKIPAIQAAHDPIPRADRFASVDLARLAKPPIY
ncbi:MAG: hypothetical protein CFE43_03045 [Burkholderiales bacterium PBB3]|nr:MAG: hypothetical protein CFE43_03045 [Burkholderiales bacterium PBB3]